MFSANDVVRQKRRLGWLSVGLVLMVVAILGRLFSLQVLNHDHYQALASKSHTRKFEVPQRRGEIYLHDRDTVAPLALNQAVKDLYADPRYVGDKVKTSRQLAALTGDPPDSFVPALSKAGEYIVLKKQLSVAVGDQIATLKLAGIGLSDRQVRTYPEGSLASQVLGFVNSDGEGQYGIEGFFDQQLAGKPGLLKANTDTQGIPIATATNVAEPPVDGSKVVLTIDRNVQSLAEKYLREGAQGVGAKSGSVIILDPETGAIKAMANWPTFDPNHYSEITDYGLFTNPITSSLFEPGSGFKLFTMAAGLDTGKVKPDTAYNDTGELQIGGRTIRNAAGHKYGQQNMVDVIVKSLNTGVIFVLRSLGGDPAKFTLAGKKTFYDYVTKHFGFGVRTGVEQAGEAAGQVNEPSSNDANYANMTFGQGISVTMIQMATAAAAIANGGKLYQPHLIDQIVLPDGKVKPTEPKLINAGVISATTSRQLTDMMIQVVEKGTGVATKLPGYKVAGKTGTAQIPKPDGTGYIDGRNIGSIVGFAPADSPRFVMIVRINEPQVPGFAESTTVPVFARIASWLLNYYAVPPTS